MTAKVILNVKSGEIISKHNKISNISQFKMCSHHVGITVIMRFQLVKKMLTF